MEVLISFLESREKYILICLPIIPMQHKRSQGISVQMNNGRHILLLLFLGYLRLEDSMNKTDHF